MIFLILLFFVTERVSANPTQIPVQENLKVCDHNDVFKLRAQPAVVLSEDGEPTEPPVMPVLELDYKNIEGKTYPFCGLVDELTVYSDLELSKPAFKLPICWQAYTAPTDYEKIKFTGNQKYFKAVKVHNGVIKIEDCNSVNYWIARKDMGTPLMILVNGSKYPLEVQKYFGVQDKTKPLEHSFSYDWCGDLKVKFTMPAGTTKYEFLKLRREAIDEYSRTECQPSAC